jgi:hypothetical protein
MKPVNIYFPKVTSPTDISLARTLAKRLENSWLNSRHVEAAQARSPRESLRSTASLISLQSLSHPTGRASHLPALNTSIAASMFAPGKGTA